MVCSATSVPLDRIVGTVWYYCVDRQDTQSTPFDESVSRTSLNKSHFVLPLQADSEYALCLIFTSKDPQSFKEPRVGFLPVRTSIDAPAYMSGLQFRTTPDCFTRKTWLQIHHFTYVALENLVSVDEDPQKWPQITRQDWAVLLFYNPPLKNHNVSQYLEDHTNRKREDDDGDAEDDRNKKPLALSYAKALTQSSAPQTATSKKETSKGASEATETWTEFVDTDWLHGNQRMSAYVKSHAQNEPNTVYKFLNELTC